MCNGLFFFFSGESDVIAVCTFAELRMPVFAAENVHIASAFFEDAILRRKLSYSSRFFFFFFFILVAVAVVDSFLASCYEVIMADIELTLSEQTDSQPLKGLSSAEQIMSHRKSN